MDKSEIKLFINNQSENLPLSSKFWKVNIIDDIPTEFFEIDSIKHMCSKIRPCNFYKLIVTFIEYNENS